MWIVRRSASLAVQLATTVLTLTVLTLAVLTAATPGPVHARDLARDMSHDSDRDHDRRRRDQVRHAVEAGEIKSLADILQAVRGRLPGDVAGVEVKRDDGRWRYEFRVVDDKGRLYEVIVDARSGEIEKIKEK